jgi:hypothetical protein
MIFVTVEGGAETVIVTGASVMIYVVVMISTVVSVITGGNGAAEATGNGASIDDGVII